MKKSFKIIYTLELLILIFIVMFKFIVLNYYPIYDDIINIAFWGLTCAIILSFLHYPRDNNYQTSSTIRLIIICLFATLIIIYTLGLYTGFTKSVFTHSLFGIIKNIFPIILLIVLQEIIRLIVAKNGWLDKKPIIILTTLFIILNIIIEIKYFNFYNLEQIFIFVCTIANGIIARNILYSYISYKINILPTILLRVAFELYPFIFPIYPDLGNYFVSFFGIAIPFILYLVLNHSLKLENQNELYIRKMRSKIIFYPLGLLGVVMIALVSGIFRYKMIAIGSNSMVPVFSKGDAVIYKQYEQTNIKNIKVGDILVFKRNNVTVTHRVYKIKVVDSKIYFTTKGDNNKNVDQFITEQANVYGVINHKLRYIGYPTIWLTEEFNKSN